MKAVLSMIATVGLLLAGCGEKSNPPAPTTNATTEGNPLTAPVDYLAAVAKAKQTAEKTVDVASLNQAIQMFNVDNGRFPKDLNELVTEKYIPRIPAAPYGMKLEYDANTGKVRVVKQ